MALALVQAINFLQALEVATQLLAGFFYAVLPGWLASQKSHESGLGMQFSCKVGPTMFKALGLITNTTKNKSKPPWVHREIGSCSSIINRRLQMVTKART